jgi:hypothetical protein
VRGGKEQSTKKCPYRNPAEEEEAAEGGSRDAPSHTVTGSIPPSGGGARSPNPAVSRSSQASRMAGDRNPSRTSWVGG